MDRGNDAFLRASERHYERLYGDDVKCAHCYEWFTPSEDALSSGDEHFCDDTCARTKLWCRDFVLEILFEDEGERSAFFPSHYRFADQYAFKHAAE